MELVDDEGYVNQPGPKVHSIETTHLPETQAKPGAIGVAAENMPQDFCPTDAGDANHSGPDRVGEGDASGFSNNDGNSGSGSGNADQRNLGGFNSGNTGDDGSGDENNRNRKPEKTFEVDDDIIIIEDDDDEIEMWPASIFRGVSPDDNTNQPLSDAEVEWHEVVDLEEDTLNETSPQPSKGTARTMVFGKGKATPNLRVKRSTLVTEGTVTVTDEPIDETKEVSSSDAGEAELMCSLQLQRINEHNHSTAEANLTNNQTNNPTSRWQMTNLTDKPLVETYVEAGHSSSTSRASDEPVLSGEPSFSSDPGPSGVAVPRDEPSSSAEPGPRRRRNRTPGAIKRARARRARSGRSARRRLYVPRAAQREQRLPLPPYTVAAAFKVRTEAERIAWILSDRIKNFSKYDHGQGTSGMRPKSDGNNLSWPLPLDPATLAQLFTLNINNLRETDQEEPDSTEPPSPIDLSKKS